MRLDEILAAAKSFVGELDVARLTADDAVAVADSFAELGKIADAGRTLALARVAETGAWRRTGASSAAVWMAQRAGTTLGDARAALETAQHLPDLPATREAFVSGRLSGVQAASITSAAAADPSAEAALLSLAEHESVSALQERCRDVRAAALGDEDATERIRRGRYLRHWTDREGAVRLNARLAADDAAPLVALVAKDAERLRAEARRSGDALEPDEAYAADALVALAWGRSGTRAVVNVHVSASALERGHTVAGETCRIDGVAPISVSAAKRLAMGGVVNIVESKGVDVRRVVHGGRTIPAPLRTALEVRDPTCVVPGCGRRRGLEIDHIVPFASGGTTSLDNLARLCRWHHAQKTHRGWRLGGVPGAWTWTRVRARSP